MAHPFKLNTYWVIFVTLTQVHLYVIDIPEMRSKRQTTCDPAEVQTGSLLLNTDENFPENGFQKAKSKLSKGMKDFLTQRNDETAKNLELEKNSVPSYPACKYKAMCKTTLKMVTKKLIDSGTEKCWVIENIIMAECDNKFEHDFSCAKFDVPEDVGVGCLPGFSYQTVLAYCSEPENKIVPKVIKIPITCKAQSYHCEEE